MPKKGVGPIFIVGTGRSGTHYLCQSLIKVQGITDLLNGKESPEMFWRMSVNAVKGKDLGILTIGYYKRMIRKAAPQRFLDQTHPNLWQAENLLKEFPDAKFIAIKRNVESVVFSMKKHGAVSSWGKNHHLYPKPNLFLGINEHTATIYENSNQIERDVFRWCSHMERIDELKFNLPQSVAVVEYEDIGKNYKVEIDRLCEFIGLPADYEENKFDEKSLHKKNSLEEHEREEIKKAMRLYHGATI